MTELVCLGRTGVCRGPLPLDDLSAEEVGARIATLEKRLLIAVQPASLGPATLAGHTHV